MTGKMLLLLLLLAAAAAAAAAAETEDFVIATEKPDSVLRISLALTILFSLVTTVLACISGVAIAYFVVQYIQSKRMPSSEPSPSFFNRRE